jgi:hypothetical protein
MKPIDCRNGDRAKKEDDPNQQKTTVIGVGQGLRPLGCLLPRSRCSSGVNEKAAEAARIQKPQPRRARPGLKLLFAVLQRER